MSYSNVYEIANKYAQRAQSVPYPKSSIKPVREGFKSATDYGKALEEYEANHALYRTQKNEYREIQGRITQSFKIELLAFLELSNHPKADTLWEMAWERGHANGYNEVAMEAEELSRLLEK